MKIVVLYLLHRFYPKHFLNEYYKDSFCRVEGQSLDYSIENRLGIYDKYFPFKKNVYVEVGANLKTSFHKSLEKYFDNVTTVELNSSVQNDFNDFNDFPVGIADCVSHYFVLEHVPTINLFVKQCFDLLKDEGIMICEVPCLSLYPEIISALILFEHVNHFTPNSLEAIMVCRGFEMLEVSYEKCSRPFGFVAVLRKKTSEISFNSQNLYQENKTMFLKGIERVKEFEALLHKTREIIISNNNVLIWVANETTNRLFDNINLTDNITVVDSDARKVSYFNNSPSVHLPDNKKFQIVNADIIIICSMIHAKDILEFILNNYNKTFTSDQVKIISIT